MYDLNQETGKEAPSTREAQRGPFLGGLIQGEHSRGQMERGEGGLGLITAPKEGTAQPRDGHGRASVQGGMGRDARGVPS